MGCMNPANKTVSEGWLQKSEFAGLRTSPASHHATTTFSRRNATKRRFWDHTMGGGREPGTGIYIYIIYIYIFKYIYIQVILY